jgi:hypothetical protein
MFNQSSNQNNGYNYLLMVIDVLSKFGWIEKLKNKKPRSIIKAFENIFKTGRICKILTTDAGTEFNNYLFSNFLTQKNIKHFIARNTEIKAAVVERFNRTIREKIFKYITANNTDRFIDVLPEIIEAYNNTVHTRTKFKPNSVNKNNEFEVFLNLYRERSIGSPSYFQIGDQVRLQKLKSHFEKGSTSNWTTEVFFIDKVLNTFPVKRYLVCDSQGNQLLGSFYKQELLKILE